MKDFNKNIDLDELFRNKLENSEVIPGITVRDQVLRRLSLKEFVRFNPLRFNIYYLAGIAAATVASILILTSLPETNTNPPGNTQIELSLPTDSLPVIESMNVKPDIKVPGAVPTDLTNRKGRVQEKQDNNKVIIMNINKTAQIEADTSLVKAELITKTVTNSGNQDIQKSKNVLIRPISAFFDVSSPVGCAPMKVKFINNSISYDSCSWEFGDGGFSGQRNPEWIFDIEGEYKIELKVFGPNGDQSSASTVITVHPRAVANFEITPEKPIVPDDVVRFLNYSKNAVRFKWEFGDGSTSNSFEPDHKYSRYGIYNIRLIALSEYGCTDTMFVKNAFSESGCFIKLPNAFIPGTDGPVGGFYSTKSDEGARIFHPTTSGVMEYQLKIFSKLGILIFESNDINIGWDGYHKGQLCEPGVYIWKVRGTYKNGEPFLKMGDLTLLRN